MIIRGSEKILVETMKKKSKERERDRSVVSDVFSLPFFLPPSTLTSYRPTLMSHTGLIAKTTRRILDREGVPDKRKEGVLVHGRRLDRDCITRCESERKGADQTIERALGILFHQNLYGAK